MTATTFDAYGPCEVWPLVWTCPPQAMLTASPAVTGIAARAATEACWALSGRQFGRCEVLLRPCRDDCAQAPWGLPPWPGDRGYPYPALIGGAWVNLVCGTCPGSCDCGPSLSTVLLPAPAEVAEVLLGGMPLATGAWRVDDARRLVRTDGGAWPACQDMHQPPDGPGAWAVRVRVGRDPPQLALLAAGELACEFVRGLNGEDCRLPRQVVSLARQGVTLSMPDPAEQARQGLLGTYFGDLFLRAYNPHRLARRARVYQVDGAPPVRQTQPPT